LRVTVTYDYQTFCRQRFGGVSRYIVELGAALSASPDISPRIFAPIHLNHYLRNYPFEKVGVFVGVENKIGRGMRPVNDLLLKTLNRLAPAHVIHQTYYSEFEAPRGSAVVVTVHDMTHELFPKMWSRFDRTPIFKRRAVERADHVICVSHSTKKDLMEICGVPASKITVTHLGYSRMDGAEAGGAPSEAPYILYVGSRSGYKNFNALLAAFASSSLLRKDFRIVAFGGGPFSAEETEVMRKHGLSPEQVKMVTGNDAALGAAYKNAAMLVYPSLYEGFGLPPLEAMSMGCPVVSSGAGPMPEVAGGAAYLFDPHNVEAIKSAMERVAYDTNERDALVERGLARSKEFSWERCAQETAAVYRKVVKSGN
jgi:glycosyltransferase involved in cell wall biosynthesis